jgi:predicted DCC family thiol-disulfide oxidoreductase YuxK
MPPPQRVDASKMGLAPLLIYDASCGFCRRWVSRLKRWDRHDRIRLLPLQDPTAPALAGRPRHALERAAHMVRPDGAVFAGAEAARELCRYLPGGWVPRAAFAVPGVMALAEHLYTWIARTWGPVHG